MLAQNVYQDYRVYHGEADGIKILFTKVKTDKWGIVDGQSELQIYEDNKIITLDSMTHYTFRGNMKGSQVANFKSESSDDKYTLKITNFSKGLVSFELANSIEGHQTQHITVCYNFGYKDGNEVDFNSLKRYYSLSNIKELKERYKKTISLPRQTKECQDFYHLYFHKSVSKKYYIALELAKRAFKHEIIENEWEWDDSENHIVTYTKDQMYELTLMYHAISGIFSTSTITDYKIYGINLEDILRSCETFRGNLGGLYCSPITLFTNYNGVLKDGIEYTRIVEDVRVKLKEQTGAYSFSDLQKILIEKYYEPRKKIINYSNQEITNYLNQNNLTYKDFKQDLKVIEEQMILENKIPTRWKSEQELYKLIKKYFPSATIHASPEWLFPQHLDVYVKEEGLAFEYQGQQHFQPVEYFGGLEKHQHQLKLDKRKKEKCKANGVNLIEWIYNEPLTTVVLRKKLKDFGKSI